MIWIIGGTTEGRSLVERIKDKDNFIVTVATESGKEFLDTDNYKVGRMTLEEMNQFIIDNKIKVIIDLTHPFAKIVSANARKVASDNNIEYIRYTREYVNIENGILVDSYEDAFEYLKDIKGTVFFTTGSNMISEFERVRGTNRFIYRVLPAIESINKCVENNVHIKDIVAMVGPFSKDMNIAMFREFKPDYIVTKDSGKIGGTDEKIEACLELGIKPIIIKRDLEEGFKSLIDLEKYIREKY
ncbi:MAG TPA: precorrin-6A reductase [Tissierellaceae bacterium]